MSRAERAEGVVDAVTALTRGRMAIVVGGDGPEPKGSLVLAAQHATGRAINFMVRFGRGLVCVPLPAERLLALGIPPIERRGSEPLATAFHVSVDYLPGGTTGISAQERAATARALADPESRPADLGMPGHLFPVRCATGGLARRRGHTEAAVDLVSKTGQRPAAVTCEILSPDGGVATLAEVARFAGEHRLPVVAVEELARSGAGHDRHRVERVEALADPLQKVVA